MAINSFDLNTSLTCQLANVCSNNKNEVAQRFIHVNSIPFGIIEAVIRLALTIIGAFPLLALYCADQIKQKVSNQNLAQFSTCAALFQNNIKASWGSFYLPISNSFSFRKENSSTRMEGRFSPASDEEVQSEQIFSLASATMLASHLSSPKEEPMSPNIIKIASLAIPEEKETVQEDLSNDKGSSEFIAEERRASNTSDLEDGYESSGSGESYGCCSRDESPCSIQ